MQPEKQKQSYNKKGANRIASKHGTTQHVCNKQENTFATNSVLLYESTEHGADLILRIKLNGFRTLCFLPRSCTSLAPVPRRMSSQTKLLLITATVAVSDWVTNCTSLQKSSGWLTPTYMVPEVSALSRAFWRISGALVGALSGALLVVHFSHLLSLFCVRCTKSKKSHQQCARNSAPEIATNSETLDPAPENQSAGLIPSTNPTRPPRKMIERVEFRIWG